MEEKIALYFMLVWIERTLLLVVNFYKNKLENKTPLLNPKEMKDNHLKSTRDEHLF